MQIGGKQRDDLLEIARRAMAERGLAPDFSPDALRQLEGIRGPAREEGNGLRDLRSLPWCSIDNDDSKDLDQITVSEDLGGGATGGLGAIAYVDALVKK